MPGIHTILVENHRPDQYLEALQKLQVLRDWFFGRMCAPTVDGSEIRNNHLLDV